MKSGWKRNLENVTNPQLRPKNFPANAPPRVNGWKHSFWDSALILRGYLSLSEFSILYAQFFHIKRTQLKNKAIKVQVLHMSHSMTNLLGVFVHTLHVFIAFGFIAACFGSKPIRCFLESDIWYRFVFVFLGSGYSSYQEAV